MAKHSMHGVRLFHDARFQILNRSKETHHCNNFTNRVGGQMGVVLSFSLLFIITRNNIQADITVCKFDANKFALEIALMQSKI